MRLPSVLAEIDHRRMTQTAPEYNLRMYS